VTLEPAAEGREAELASVGAFGSEIEAREPEPIRDDVLAAMPGLEDAQDARLEVAAFVLRHRQVVVLDLAQAGPAEPGGADIGARRLLLLSDQQRPVDRRRDQRRGVGQRDGAAVVAA
jgi:hypothetical protein